jgi:hypothetical protein
VLEDDVGLGVLEVAQADQNDVALRRESACTSKMNAFMINSISKKPLVRIYVHMKDV